MAVVITLTVGSSEPATLSADTPEGTVQRYLQAITDRDYEAAHALLALSVATACPLDDFRQGVRWYEDREFTARLGGSRVVGGETEVTVRISERSTPPPFGTGESLHAQRYRLLETDAGWRLAAVGFPARFCAHERLPVREAPPPTTELAPAEPEA